MLKYTSGSIPVRLMERLASPRTASAEPVMVGEIFVISGHSRSCSLAFCHWSIEGIRCTGRCTIGVMIWPDFRLAEGPCNLVRWDQLDMRLRCQYSLEEVSLESRKHGGHEDDDRNAE